MYLLLYIFLLHSQLIENATSEVETSSETDRGSTTDSDDGRRLRHSQYKQQFEKYENKHITLLQSCR